MQPTGLKASAANAQVPGTTGRPKCLDGLEPSLFPHRAFMGQTRPAMSHECLIGLGSIEAKLTP